MMLQTSLGAAVVPLRSAPDGVGPMRFMVLVKAGARSLSGGLDPEALAAAMAGFDRELALAGMLISADGLEPAAEAARLRGPGADPHPAGVRPASRDRIAGYWMVSARSQAEVVERFRRCPALEAVEGCEIEIHRLFEAEPRSRGGQSAQGVGAALAFRVTAETKVPRVGSGRLSPKRLKAVLDFIEANLEHDLKIDRIARQAGFSPSHFQALFRATMGVSAHRYVVERRVRQAQALLESGAVSISETAAACGFCHQSHLARAMRQVLGKAPSEFVERTVRHRRKT